MNLGKLFAGGTVLAAALAGGGMYYLQVYGYYDTLPEAQSLSMATPEGQASLPLTVFEGIDAHSSPLRYRACVTFAEQPEATVPYAGAVPLNGPAWFDCFDAAEVGADLEAGRAEAVLVEGNFVYGFDRVMALYPDGRGRIWHQANACAEAFYDGDPVPPGCPPAPAE